MEHRLDQMLNYAEPIELDEQTVDKFIQENVCAQCGLSLLKVPLGKGIFYVECVQHGVIHETEYQNRTDAHVAKRNAECAWAELRAEERKKTRDAKRTPADVLKEMGF